MRMPGNFFDTNILIYLASNDVGKASRAHELVQGGGAISVQVLNEIANVGRRNGLAWAEIGSFIATLRELLNVHPLTAEIHETGLALAERYKLSVYDSMIVASALHADCDKLWSEDMHDGLTIGPLRLLNPFLNGR